jgi:hypothetical protein
MLGHLSPAFWRNLGDRPRESCWFRPRLGFRGLDTNQSMHVDLTCVCMCVGGLMNAVDMAPHPVSLASHVHIAPGS